MGSRNDEVHFWYESNHELREEILAGWEQFNKDLEYDLSLPGGLYFAPSIGYRYYFNPYFGLNFELGYEKGAILQGGLVVKFNTKKANQEKKTEN